MRQDEASRMSPGGASWNSYQAPSSHYPISEKSNLLFRVTNLSNEYSAHKAVRTRPAASSPLPDSLLLGSAAPDERMHSSKRMDSFAALIKSAIAFAQDEAGQMSPTSRIDIRNLV
jgi:hypothetical protein